MSLAIYDWLEATQAGDVVTFKVYNINIIINNTKYNKY